MISHDTAIRIIAQHGWEPTDITAWNPSNPNDKCEDETFYRQLGIRKQYSQRKVMLWLGY